MVELLKSVYSLVKLRNKIFINTIRKAENWSKIIAIVLLVFLFLNAIQSSAFTIKYVKDNFNQSSILYRPLFNLILFVIFLSNIFTVFFLSGSNYSQNIFKTLLCYPIRLKRIISYEIISGVGDIISLLFLPLYIAAIFIPDSKFALSHIVTIPATLLLLSLLISSIIFFIKNLFALIYSSRHSQKLIYLIALLSGVIFIVIIRGLSLFLKDPYNVTTAAHLLEFSPTGVYSSFILNVESSLISYNFLSTISYFLILNLLLYTLNYRLARFLRNRSYGKSTIKFSSNGSLLTRLYRVLPANPFSKKDIVYTLRSSRTMFLHLMMAVFIPILISVYIKNTLDKGQNLNSIINQFSFSILFIFSIGLNFAGNIFAFEGNAIINYFFRPISYTSILKSKTFIPNYYAVIILLTNLILLLILHTEFIIIISYESLIGLNYFLLLLLALPLSVYFPKAVDFDAMNGFLTSLISLFIFLVLAFVLWFIFQTALTFYLHSDYKFLIFLILCFMLAPLFYYKEKIYSSIGGLLSKRKEKIIGVFR